MPKWLIVLIIVIILFVAIKNPSASSTFINTELDGLITFIKSVFAK